MLIKKGEAIQISKIENAESVIPALDPKILDNFRKIALDQKKVAPKADDFLYFSAIMMHAAEASAINEDGSPRLTASGQPVQVGWEKKGDSMKWISNDRNVLAYKNSNGDIFPEEELVKAHKKWIDKPLCIDHKSDSVDHVRGFIVDTYYDRNLKRVIALCALDKKNYPDLARKVSSGYSNSVSMGTAVGKAICYDCGTVASREDQFCNHMRSKSCYGEINVDLNPLELSIVVNGADPKAHIKHIIAAANNLNNFVNDKKDQLSKFAENSYNAKITFNGSEDGANQRKEIEINSVNLEQFQDDIEKAFEDLKTLSETANNLESDKLGDENSLDNGIAPPHERYASAKFNADLVKELQELRSINNSTQAQLNEMARSFNRLASNINKEENMSGSRINKKGYYLGTEEPTPGQVKYPADPLNDKLRTDEDRQMLVDDMGPVDGLHPGPKSVGMSELERKKMLARAQADERAMRREAIVALAKESLKNKSAYFQGGGGVNEPTPGKTKYPVDKMNEELRDREDKQMVGQKPFPDVGDVSGLHPSPASVSEKDELKRKQMLSRANSLRGRFVVANKQDGSRDLGNSAWEVYRGDDLLLTASVNSLTGGNVDMLFDKVATKEFGSRLIDKIKVHGADRVKASLTKSAQVAPPPAAPAPTAPAAPAAPPMDQMPADMGMETGFEMPAPEEAAPTNKHEEAVELADKAYNTISDLSEILKELNNEDTEMGGNDFAGLESTEPTVAPGGSAPLAAAASFNTRTLFSIKKELNSELKPAVRETITTLKGYASELTELDELYRSGNVNKSNRAQVDAIVSQACDETKEAIADGFRLMTAFVKYARGSEAVIKRAELDCALNKEHKKDLMDTDDDLSTLLAQTDKDLNDAEDLLFDDPELSSLDDEDDDEGADLEDLDLDGVSLKGLPIDDDTEFDDSLELSDLESDRPYDDEDHALFGDRDGFTPTHESKKSRRSRDLGESTFDDFEDEDDLDSDLNDAIMTDNVNDAISAQKADPNADVILGKSAALNTKAGRAALRAKLAADTIKMSPMLDAAHPKGSHRLTSLDTDSGDLSTVEDLKDAHKKTLDMATAPVKVRKQAAEIHDLIRQGKMNESDLSDLVKEGLDKDAVAYYKKYYGQVDGGSEFATELVKEHAKAAMQVELDTYKIKLARAYSLANDMVARGLCLDNNTAISKQVDEIMQFNDESFDSLKRVVAKHAPTSMQKTAGRIPQVGILSNDYSSSNELSLQDQLTIALSGSGKRRF